MLDNSFANLESMHSVQHPSGLSVEKQGAISEAPNLIWLSQYDNQRRMENTGIFSRSDMKTSKIESVA